MFGTVLHPIYARRSILLAAISFAVVLSSCSGDTPQLRFVSVSEAPTPAGPQSGEPFLSASEDAVFLSWLEASESGGHDLLFARLDETGWTEARLVAHSDRFFVNWADFPSIVTGPGGSLWAHWLERGPQGGYDYGVRVVRSTDGGASWSDPWIPHDDDSPTEHGFVSMFAMGDRMAMAWLDGRKSAEGADRPPPTHEMTLRYREVALDGTPGPELLLDGRVCDCCQTTAAMTTAGPVVAYRDRSPAEIRDIYVARMENGVWTKPAPVHDDGWEIAGCPVNGPSLSAQGDDVALAWFTAPGDVPNVKVAFSSDAGRSFGSPIVVDDGNPGGRVDILQLEDGSALVSWLERTGGDAAEVRLRHVAPDGFVGQAVTVTNSSAERASGFPRMIRALGGGVLFAWTDVSDGESRVRVTAIELEGS